MSPIKNTSKCDEKQVKGNSTNLDEDEDKAEVQADINRQTNASDKLSRSEIRKRSKIFFHRQHRVIIRNLSYRITESKLRKEFERFGTLEEVNILKRPDGKLVGCAFLQYSTKEESDRAIQEMDSEIFMGRKIEVCYAVDKSDYKKVKNRKEVKTEEIKQDPEEVIDDDAEVKTESTDDEDDEDDDANEEEEEEEDDDEDDGDDDDDDDDEEEEQSDDDMDEEEQKPVVDEKPKIKRKDNHSEVEEGRTVFVKNIPYEVEAAELKEVMEQFGTVQQVLINKDRISGHSKGTAFVIFKLKDSAQMSCRQNLKLQIHDQFLEILEALRKKDITDRTNAKAEKRSKDSRNLYLLKEGIIMAGSPAAKDVSKTDMAQRLRLEQRNNEMLKSFNRFVAKDRLTVHNIPPHFSNDDLRKIVIQHTSYKPIECRVMRDSRPSFGNPLGASRGYGFLSFKQHETALEVLRKLNNNPSVFGKNNRPIVAFSIEDLKVHKIKQQRLEKSRLKNPTYQKKMEEIKQKKQQKVVSKKAANRLELQKLAVAPSVVLQKLNSKGANLVDTSGIKKKERKRDIEITPFTGEIAKKGRTSIRSNRKIHHQANSHMERIKAERKEQRKKKVKQEHAQNRLQKSKPPQKKPKLDQELHKEDSYFKQTVGKYKDMISNITKQSTRGKWYTG
ncbi:RNA-binding protein 28-like [Anopheles ziemanni]|uniref:RNA-binding protein 28-like n=1 Tax=Anopheles coustani TaxID=139045 RepID=UPI00265AAABF|nr:RNA-binding protein 28-like [Anopheles coustani]XP_058170772.1 RNA-binding protein 28-like [Anopheles ziemanni]